MEKSSYNSSFIDKAFGKIGWKTKLVIFILSLCLKDRRSEARESEFRHCTKGDLSCRIKTIEARFEIFRKFNSTNKRIIIDEFTNAIDSVVKKACKNAQNVSSESEKYSGNFTQIDVVCIQPQRSGNDSTGHWSFMANSSVYNKITKTNRQKSIYIPVQISMSESVEPCDNNGNQTDMTCYAIVTSFDLRRSESEYTSPTFFEGLLVTYTNRSTTSRQGEIECNLKKQMDDPTEFSCDFFIPTTFHSDNITNASNSAACNCTQTGVYREIYFDVKSEDNDYFLLSLDQEGASFWLNFSYKEKVHRNKRKSFEEFLLSQILQAVKSNTGGIWNATNLELRLAARNTTHTLVVLGMSIYLNNNSALDPTPLLTILDQLLITGTLGLVNDTNHTLPIEKQRLILNAYGEHAVDVNSEPQEDSIFVWFVVAVAILIAVILIVVAIRKHQSESEDNVEPMMFQPDDLRFLEGHSPGHGGRGCGNVDGPVTSARSITTMLSESSNVSDETQAVGNINAVTVGIGNRSFEREESPRSIPSAFQVTSAAYLRSILAPEEGNLDKISYLHSHQDINEHSSAFP